MNYKIISYFLGWVLKVEAIAMVIPFIISAALKEDSWPWFLACILFSGLLGLFLSRKKMRQGNFYIREGYVATGLSWLLMSLVGALPFYLSGRIPSYIDAFFEMSSGFTTTGSSILEDIDSLGKGLIFWRSFSHWIGGMGVLVLILAILPMNGGYHMQFMKAESPGPSVSKLVPRVSDTAKTLYGIYFGMTVVAILTLLISGMPLFDAVLMGVGAAGTGGFAISNQGLSCYNTVSQALITVWMILFGINFNVYYLIARKKYKDALKCEEMRYYLLFIAAATLIFTVVTWQTNYKNEGLFYAFHHCFFTVGSLITSTGYGTVDFNLWPETLKMLILLLMFSGACAGSTGGGFKVSRVIILAKEAKKEFYLLFHPSAVRTVKFEGKTVEHSVIRSINNYLIIYLMTFTGSLLLISLDGFDLTTNFSAVLATLNNIGPGLGAVGPASNFSAYSVFSKLVLSFDMIAGRLELLPVLALFYRKTWIKHN